MTKNSVTGGIPKALTSKVATETFRWISVFFIFLFIAGDIVFFHHFVEGGFPYKDHVMKVGYYIHVISGSVYFIISLVQFWGYFRQHYPKIHRTCGYFFFAFQFISSIAICIFTFRNKSNGNMTTVIYSFVLMIYWNYTAYQALRTIFLSDVISHNIWILRNVVAAWNIILSRPLIFAAVVLYLDKPDQIQIAITTGTIASFFICWFLGEVYIYAKYGEGIFGNEKSSVRNPQRFTAFENTPKTLMEDKQAELMPTDDLIKPELHLIPMPSRILTDWVEAILISSSVYSSSLLHLRIQLQASPNPLIIPPGHHISLKHPKFGIRSYTPISSPLEAARGTIELLASLHPHGKMSNYLNSLPTSSLIQVSPVSGSFISPKTQPNILMVAGGSGITPFMNIVSHLAPQPTAPKITLIYSSRIPIPDFVNEHFENIATRFPNFKYLPVMGRVEKNMVLENCPDAKVAKSVLQNVANNGARWTGEGAAVLVCGPKSLEDDVAKWVKKKQLYGSLVWRFSSNGR